MRELTDKEKAYLEKLEKKSQIVRDRVRGVVNRWDTGLILWGKGGTCKSFTVFQELARQGYREFIMVDPDDDREPEENEFILTNSRITGRGLFDKLMKYPRSIHVMEDCETLLDDKKAWGVLRSALYSQSKERPPVRPCSWNAHKVNLSFQFTGAIIYIANRDMRRSAELDAIKTRVPVMEMVASRPEISALMVKVANEGFRFGTATMTSAECLEVTDYLISRLEMRGDPIDMRTQGNAFKDYLQWAHEESNTETDWHDLVDSRLKRQNTSGDMGRAKKIADQVAVAREIEATPGLTGEEKVKLWIERTGSSRPTYFRMLKKALA